MTKHSPIRYLKTSPEVIRLAVMMYVRFPLSLRNVEDLLREGETNLAGPCSSFVCRQITNPMRNILVFLITIGAQVKPEF